MKFRIVIPVALSVISLILIGAVNVLGSLPHYSDLNLSPLRVIYTDTNKSNEDHIQRCANLLAKSTLPPLAPRLSGADFLTPPVTGITIREYTVSGITPIESLAQDTKSNDFRCSA
jgi:hypothetical protein